MTNATKTGDKPDKAAEPAAKTRARPATAKTPAAKKPAATKPAATKAAAPKTAAPKTAAKKPAAKKAVAGAAPARPAIPRLTPDQRRYYVEVAAFYIAERRGFHGGSQMDDWVKAEAEIDRLVREGVLKP